jgi:hypothetical protein
MQPTCQAGAGAGVRTRGVAWRGGCSANVRVGRDVSNLAKRCVVESRRGLGRGRRIEGANFGRLTARDLGV